MMCALYSHSQNYTVSFTGVGAAMVIEIVQVENLTQGTKITLGGNEKLKLVGLTSAQSHTSGLPSSLMIYPNPAYDNVTANFFAPASGSVSIAIYDVSGKILLHRIFNLPVGMHSFDIVGLSCGIYLIQVKSENYNYSGKAVSRTEQNKSLHINYLGGSKDPDALPQLKNNFDEPVMLFNEGDRLKFTAISGNYRTVVTDIPATDKTIFFNFMDCTDGDGNHYPVVEIGNQTWMAENLKTTKYNDAQNVSLQVDGNLWATLLKMPLYCWYQNDKVNKNISGALYNWFAVNTNKLCPSGWHVPSDEEWKLLEKNIGLTSEQSDATGWRGTHEANKLKETGTNHWEANENATNETGFTARAGGYRNGTNGTFTNMNISGDWWTSTETAKNSELAWYRGIASNSDQIDRTAYAKRMGCSVRCTKGDVVVPKDVLKIYFTTVYINRDNEVGSGEWRIYIKINGITEVYIPKYEADAKMSIPIYQTFYTDPSWDKLNLEFIAYEFDDEFIGGPTWNLIGAVPVTYNKTGDIWPGDILGGKQIVLDAGYAGEGKVTLNYYLNYKDQ